LQLPAVASDRIVASRENSTTGWMTPASHFF